MILRWSPTKIIFKWFHFMKNYGCHGNQRKNFEKHFLNHKAYSFDTQYEAPPNDPLPYLFKLWPLGQRRPCPRSLSVLHKLTQETFKNVPLELMCIRNTGRPPILEEPPDLVSLCLHVSPVSTDCSSVESVKTNKCRYKNDGHRNKTCSLDLLKFC